MITCPNCQSQLVQDAENPHRLFCQTCGYVLEASGDAPTEEVVSAIPAPQPITPQPVPQEAPSQQSYWGTQGTGPAAYEARQAAEAAPGTVPGAASAYPGAPGASETPAPSKGFAIAALVLGILGILNFWIPFVNAVAIVFGILALIFGIIAVSRVKKGTASGKGMGIAGIVLGALSIVLSIVISVVSTFLVGAYYTDGLGNAVTSQQGGNTTRGGAVSGADAPWASLEFTLDGKSYQLDVTTLEEFESQSGWAIDLSLQGYPDGYTVQSGEQITTIALESDAHPMDSVYVTVSNGTQKAQDLKQCVITDISVTNYSGELSMELPGGISFSSTLDEALEAYGEPYYSYTSETSGFRSLTYDAGDFERELRLISYEGALISEMELSIYA